MGYITEYEITCDDLKAMEAIRKMVQWAEELNDDPLIILAKWYEHEKDFKFVSKTHPKAKIKVRGSGENSADIWVKIYKGGKLAGFKEFDWSMLE